MQPMHPGARDVLRWRSVSTNNEAVLPFLGLLLAAPGVGATVAALIHASVDKFRVGTRSICICVLGFALFLTLFSFSHVYLFSFLFLAGVGLCQIAERSLTNAAIQIGTPQELLGRVPVYFLWIGNSGPWAVC